MTTTVGNAMKENQHKALKWLASTVADIECGLTLTLPEVQSVPTPEGARFALRVAEAVEGGLAQ